MTCLPAEVFGMAFLGPKGCPPSAAPSASALGQVWKNPTHRCLYMCPDLPLGHLALLVPSAHGQCQVMHRPPSDLNLDSPGKPGPTLPRAHMCEAVCRKIGKGRPEVYTDSLITSTLWHVGMSAKWTHNEGIFSRHNMCHQGTSQCLLPAPSHTRVDIYRMGGAEWSLASRWGCFTFLLSFPLLS